FLNFDGAVLAPSPTGDARHDASDLVHQNATYPRFNAGRLGPDEEEVRRDIASRVLQLYVAYDLDVMPTRPTDTDDYVMVMVGGRRSDTGTPDSARGFAPLDCNDGNPHDVVLVFAESLMDDYADDPIGSRGVIASVVAQESAHAYGLVHTDNTRDVMYPYVQPP